ncbi:MAG TPA: pyrroloquinoline quinone-dependent dehydrogenase [Rhizomicrobium sp.]|nr:pyrroloquinoline quinone-dependent dehydrogenase [Rhizomicrobium sp.]
MKRLLWAAGMTALALTKAQADTGWSQYGGDQGGQRHSAATQITPANVTKLRQAWSYSTGAMTRHAASVSKSAFENTPILAEGKLFVCSSFQEVSAIDPGTGREIWRFDPHLADDSKLDYPNSFNCRGVAYWKGSDGKGRIYLAANNRRLYALDAATGKPIASFGDHGSAVIYGGQLRRPGEMQFSSTPIVSHGVVVVGSSIDDNQMVDEARGTVHAFDAMTGAAKWSFDPVQGQNLRAGASNVWAPISADDARGLVYLPTSSPSPDFWGGYRTGSSKYSNAVVALKIESGEVVWSFQSSHHDVWDYDVASQPTLGRVTYKGKTIDAVLQPTKQGLLFTLDRESGQPIIPVEERKVPQGAAPGDKLSPTQPFPIAPQPLAPTHISADDAFGLTFWDRGKCREMIKGARNQGIYTPPSTQGTIVYPFTGGGTNWGGLSFDAGRNVVFVNTSNMMHLVTLIPAKDIDAMRKAHPHEEISRNRGAPFGMWRRTLLSPWGLPCNPPPWGKLHAVDMRDGKILWSVPLGTTEDLAPFSQYILGKTGTPNLGGPISTASGLVFIGAAMDNYLRAFDAKSGVELWKGRLPAGGQATPMTYMWKGKQYVVIAAGGHEKLGSKRGDQVIAFALPT